MRSFLLGAKTEVKSWTNPYITDGLVAMWDGEWNVGGGNSYDPSATTWKDISGNGHDVSVTSFSWGDDHSLEIPIGGGTVVPSGMLPNVSVATIEICGYNHSTGDNVNPAVRLDSTVAFGILGGHRYSTVGTGKARFGFVCSNQVTGFISTDETDYSAEFKFSASMIYDTVTKSNNQIYYGGEFASRFVYANETGLTGNLRVWFNSNFPTGIKSIRVYNRSLSPDEIAANYAVDARRFGL